MRGGNPLEAGLMRAFWSSATKAAADAAIVLRRIGLQIIEKLPKRGPAIPRRVATELPPAVERQVGTVVENAAAPLLSRLSEYTMSLLVSAGGVATSMGGAVGGLLYNALAAGLPILGSAFHRSLLANPARARELGGLGVDLLGFLRRQTMSIFQKVSPQVEAFSAAAGELTPGRLTGTMRPVVEGVIGDASTVAAEMAAVVRPPIPQTGPISRAFLEDLFSPDHVAAAPGRIAAFFRANPELKVPSEWLKAVRLPEKIAGQKGAFLKEIFTNGRFEGTPAEIMEAASEFMGKEAAAKLLEPLANPIVAARAAEKAAIDRVTGTLAEQAQKISELIRQGLEKAVQDEAGLIVDAASAAARAPKITPGAPVSDAKRLQGMMNIFMNNFNRVFGAPPSTKDALLRFVPTPKNIEQVLSTGIGNAGVANYSAWLQAARTQFMGQMTLAAQKNFMEVMTPEVMGQFRQGMMRVFAHDAALAEEVIEQFATRVIPVIQQIESQAANAQLNIFLAALRSAPTNAGKAVLDLIGTISDSAAKSAASVALSQAKFKSNMPARILGRLAAGTLTGGVGLFAVMLQGTPNGGGLSQGSQGGKFAGVADAVRDGVYRWFGVQLWENPPPDNSWGAALASAGGFENVESMTKWLATQGRQWFLGFMGAIAITLGVTAKSGAEWVVSFFRGTPTVSSSSSSSSAAGTTTETSGGRRKKRRTVRKYR